MSSYFKTTDCVVQHTTDVAGNVGGEGFILSLLDGLSEVVDTSESTIENYSKMLDEKKSDIMELDKVIASHTENISSLDKECSKYAMRARKIMGVV